MRRPIAVPALLLVNAFLYAWVALLFLLDSQTWFAAIGVEQATAAAYTELKTVYVGLMGAMAGFFAFCALRRDHLRPGVLFLLISYVGLVAGRSWGILVDGAYNSLVLQLYVVEWLALLLAALAYWWLTRRSA